MQNLSCLAISGLFFLSGSVYAHQVPSLVNDSSKAVQLKEVEIVSTRATKQTPMVFSNISKKEIESKNTGVDIPFLLNMTPSLINTSDAGLGIGYTSLRIRGIDGSRINVTTNGIPMNDADEQTYFWVDAPDLSSSLQSIQVQRGAGSSANGAAAFGATISMETDAQPVQPHAEISADYGSYNTEKETVTAGTGLIGGHFVFDGRLSNIKTDGFLQRASVKLNSYFAQGGYYNGNTFLKFLIFGGKERTYHAWNYDWKPGMNRRYNSCGTMYTDAQGVTHYYPNQIDDYLQTNYQVLFHHRFNRQWNLNLALHNTYGYGYYEEYKKSQDLVAYDMSQFEGTTTSTDLVRRKLMKNTFMGGVYSLDYTKEKLHASLGGGLNRYYGHHFGRVTWAKDIAEMTSSVTGTQTVFTPNYEYYRNRILKVDGNVYLKATYELLSGLNAYVDAQFRRVHYTIKGTNDKFDYNTQAMQPLNVRENFNFFNPKGGLNWQINSFHRIYTSFSIAQREPTRDCYTNSVDLNGKPLAKLEPKSEKFYDYELGYQYNQGIWQLGVNLYYMNYKNQLVQNGELNDIGEAVFINVPKSYRCGVEFQATLKPCHFFDWEVNATLSRNRIKNYTQSDAIMDEDWNQLGTTETFYKSATIAFSPSFILNNGLNFHCAGFEAQLQSHYVSRQYLTNTHEKGLSIAPYFVSDLNTNYTFHLSGVKSITVGFTIYNIFNEEYESNGWGSRVYYPATLAGAAGALTYAPDYGLSAQAGFHVMGHVTIKF